MERVYKPVSRVYIFLSRMVGNLTLIDGTMQQLHSILKLLNVIEHSNMNEVLFNIRTNVM